MHYRSGNPTSELQESATNYNVASYHSLSQIYKFTNDMEVPFPLIIVNKFKCNETTRRERHLTFAAPPKSPRRVRMEARTLAVHLEVDVATPR